MIWIDGYIKLVGDIMVLLIRNSCFFRPTPCGVAHSTSPSFWLVGLAGSNPSDGQKMVFIYRIRYCAKQVVAPSFISKSEEIPYCRESDSALKLCVKSKNFLSCDFVLFESWWGLHFGIRVAMFVRILGLIDCGRHLVSRWIQTKWTHQTCWEHDGSNHLNFLLV